MSAQLRVARDTESLVLGADEIVVDYTSLPRLIPDGEYGAVFLRHETAIVHRAPKVFLWFRIVDPGPYMGVELYRPYRAHKLLEPPRKGGKFKVRSGSHLVQMLFRLNGFQHRVDRISLRELRGCVLRIRTRTVTQNSHQMAIPDALRYSVVDDILAKETGPK